MFYTCFSLNVSKTNFVIFNHNKIDIPENLTMKIGNENIERKIIQKFSKTRTIINITVSYRFYFNRLIQTDKVLCSECHYNGQPR